MGTLDLLDLGQAEQGLALLIIPFVHSEEQNIPLLDDLMKPEHKRCLKFDVWHGGLLGAM